MRKIVINTCFGGFGLSVKALEQLGDGSLERDNPVLVKIVEELGQESWGVHAELQVVEIPDDVKWHIHEYDGSEYVAEDHRTWS